MDNIFKEARAKIKYLIESDDVIDYFITSSKIIDKAGSNLIKYQRFSEYEVLKENLLPLEAKRLMRMLWDAMQLEKSSIYYRKYCEDKRRGKFLFSIGGGDLNSERDVDRRVVAIAWAKIGV